MRRRLALLLLVPLFLQGELPAEKLPAWRTVDTASPVRLRAEAPASSAKASPRPARSPLSIQAPRDGSYLRTPTTAVRVRADDAILSLSVNGIAAARDSEGIFVAESVPLPEGPVTLTARGVGRDGSLTTASIRVTADRTPPRLTVSSGGAPLLSGAVLRGGARPVIEATDRSPVTLRAILNGKPFTSGSEVTQEGSYTLEIEAADRAGNVSRRSLFFRVAARPPELSGLEPPSGTVMRGASVTVSGECDDAVHVHVAGVAASLYGRRFVARAVALAPGSNALSVVARDAAGNESRTDLKLIRDEIAPRLAITSPAPGLLTNEASAVVRGTATDEHLVEVKVAGAPARLSGSAFEATVRLTEGPNRLTVVARDAAGNRTESYLDVTRDSTPPQVAITFPATGSVVPGPGTEVVGEVADATLDRVSVNGLRAPVNGGRFRVDLLPLAKGENTITATAFDRAGNSAKASVSVSRDEGALPLLLDLSARPVLGSRSADITGSVPEGAGAKVTVNDVAAEVSGNRFRASGLKLNEGINTVTVRASDRAGRTAVAVAVLAVDTAPPEILSSSPADGAQELPLATVVRLKFSEPLDPATVTASTLRLEKEGNGEGVAASLFVEGQDVALLPHAALEERTAYRLLLSDSVADLAGNRLRKGLSARFVTGRATPPAPPQLDPLPPALCAQSVRVSGQADPGARVRIEGGAVLETAVAGADGRFAATVALRPESINALRISASDGQDRSSSPVAAVLLSDCTPPRVERVSSEAGRLEVVFSEPVDPESVGRQGAVRWSGPRGASRGAPKVRLEEEGRVAVFEDPDGLLADGGTVTVEASVKDLAGNSLPAPFVTLLAPTGAAALQDNEAGLSGQVFDDRIGRPLSGAIVTVVAVDGIVPPSPPSMTTDADGRFALVVPAGEIALRAARAGYTAALRIGTVAAGDSITVFDFRLTPETIVAARADGSAEIADRELSVTLPAGSAAAGSNLRAASLSPQGLPALAPLGWSPAAAISLELGPATAEQSAPTTLPAPASASWSNRFAYPAGTALLLARYDAATRRYLAAGTASLSGDASRINAASPTTGVYAVFVADPPPNNPPQPSPGQPLTGVAAPSTDPILSATLVSDPRDVLPTQTADITTTLSLSAPVPSGYPVEVLVSETLTLLNGQQIQAPSFLENLTVLRNGAGQALVPFRVRPSATAAQVALSVGFENLLVRRYTFDLRRGNLVGSGGGTVTGPGGFSVSIPAAALGQTVPVTLAQVSAAGLGVAVPAGFRLLAAVRLDLGGQTLALPAQLRWASATDPTGNGLIWVEVAEVNGFTRPRFTGPGRYDSAGQLVETTPAAVHNLPVPGVVRGGLYALLSAEQPLSYVTGRVLDVDALPVAAAVVTEDGTSVMALTDGLGAWALPIPAAGGTVRSLRVDTGNAGETTVPAQSAGGVVTRDISLVVTAPYVLSVAPAAASALPLTLPVVFTLSEPLNPATVGNSSVVAVSGSVPIPGSVRLAASGTLVTFTPSGSWPARATVQLTLSSSVTDLQGYRLVDRITRIVANFVVAYTTIDPTPPSDINPLLIAMGLPTGSPPTVTIVGGAGAACGGCTVIATNETTTATSSTTALSNGSFTLTLPARTTDRVSITIRRPAGGEIQVNPGPFREDGGRIAYLSARAADYVTTDGIRVTVDEGAFPLPVTLKVKPIAQAALPAPLPSSARFIAGIEFDPGDSLARKPVDLAVAAPPGVTGGQFLVARAVQVLGQTRWMVVDTARYDNGAITTRPVSGGGSGVSVSSGSLVGASESASTVSTPSSPGTAGAPVADAASAPVFVTQAAGERCPELAQPGGSKGILDRVIRKSNIVILGVDMQLGFMAAEATVANPVFGFVFTGPYESLQAQLPFVWVAKEAKQQCYFAMPVPLNVPFDLLARDATTGLTLFQTGIAPVTDSTNVTVVPRNLLPASPAPPRLLSGSPFTARTFIPLATASDTPPDRRSLASGVQYSFVVVSGSGTVKLYGDPGSVEKCPQAGQCSQSLELSLTNNVQRLDATATAAADGSFGPLSVVARPGEDVTFVAGSLSLAPTASLRLNFSTELAAELLKPDLALRDAATPLDFDLVPDFPAPAKSRSFTLRPLLPFANDHPISLTLTGGGPDQVPKTLNVKMSSPRADVIGRRDVADVNSLYLKGGLLLEVTGDAGNVGDPGPKLNLYDATDPGSLVRCSSLPLNAFARGVMMDDHDRVLVAMGGGGANGRVQVFRLSPYTGTGACGGRTLLGEGAQAGDLDRSFTEVTIRAGAGGLGVLPEGFPRKLQLLSRESRETIVLDSETSLPSFVTQLVKTDLLPPGQPDGKQDPNAPLGVIGRVPPNPGPSAQPSPWNQPVTVINKTAGASWTAYTDTSGNFSINARASSGDRLEFRVNAAEEAILGTEAFGLQGVDANKTVHLFGQDCIPGSPPNDICEIGKRLRFSFGRIGELNPPICRSYDPLGDCFDAFRNLSALNDIVLLPKPAALQPGGLPAPGEPAEPTVLAVVNRFGLATFSLTGEGEDVFINQLGPGIPLFTFDVPRIFPTLAAVSASRGWPVKPSGDAARRFCSQTRWKDPSGNAYRPSLAFVASSEGVFVVDVTNARASSPRDPAPPQPLRYGEPGVLGLFKMTGTPSTLSVDGSRGLLYVGLRGDSGPGGVAVYDMTDPCTVDRLDLTPGRVALPADPRRIAYVPLADQNVNTPFVLDADTGVLFGAADPTGAGNGAAFSLALTPPPLSFVADTDRNGVDELVSKACPLGVSNPEKQTTAPYCPDVVRVLAPIFGKTGREIVVELSSTSTTGIALPPPPPGFARTKTYVKLTRQSDDPADVGYNRYLSPPIVLIADPRARRNYQLANAEKEQTAAPESREYSCRNCRAASGYDTELAGLATAPPAPSDGESRTTPIGQAFEQWAGEKLIARLAWDAQAETDLKARASYLTSFDLRSVKAEVLVVRGELTPSLRQAPRLNPSVVGDEVGSGVVLSSGELLYSMRDLFIAGRGLSFALDRFYASQAISFGPLGRSWDSPLFARLRELPSGDVEYYDGTGRRELFRYDAANRRFDPPSGRFAELYRHTDRSFFLRERDNTTLKFDETGRLFSISDAVRTRAEEENPDGNRMRFFYDGAGRLSLVQDSLDHEVRFEYYAADSVPGQDGAYPGFLKTVTDQTSREVLYRYDDRARLVEVALPEVTSNGGGPTFAGINRRKYKYSYAAGPAVTANLKGAILESDNLLTVKNARDQEVLRFEYSDAFALGALESVGKRFIAGVGESYSYTPLTRRASFVSRRGHETSVEHDPAGHAVRSSLLSNSAADAGSTNPLSANVPSPGVVPPGPFETLYSYAGEDGLTSVVTLPSGRSVARDYPSVPAAAPDRRKRGNVTSETVAGAGLALRDEYAYNDLVNGVISHRDPTGATTRFDRDPRKGFVTRVNFPASVGLDAQNPPLPRLDIDRDPDTGQARSHADRAGVAMASTYFPRGQAAYGYVSSQTERAASAGTIYTPVVPSVTNYTRDARGNVLSVTDPRSTITNFEVNEADQVVRVTVGAAGVDRRFEYDADGNLVRETFVQTPLGTAARSYAYDALGRRTSETQGGLVAALATTQYVYASTGELLAVVHPEGETDLTIHDARGLLVASQRRHADGTASAFRTLTRDLDGRVIEDFDGVNTRTLVHYDGVGRPDRVTAPRGAQVRVEYDGADRPTRVTVVDPGNGDILKERRIEYAGNGQVSRQIELIRKLPADSPTESARRYFYDLGGRLVQTNDPEGRQALRCYDDHGRLARLQDAVGNVTTLEYDLSGNLFKRHTFEIKPDGTSEAERIETMGYDPLNRMSSFSDPGNHQKTYGYDESSNLLFEADHLTHKTSFGYDERGRRLSMVDPLGNVTGGDPAAHRTQWSYDRSNKIRTMVDANTKATTYGYDSIGRLKDVTYPDTRVERRTYNGDGTVATLTDPNGSVATFTYGPDDQVEQVLYGRGTGVVGLTQETYGYDKLGRLVSGSGNAGVGAAARATSRTYDSLDRLLTEAQDGKTLSYVYDLVGNPTEVTYPGSNRRFRRMFDGLDRIKRVEEITGTARTVRSIDYVGFNRVAKQAFGNIEQVFGYDQARRLTSLTATDTSTSTQIARYVYGWADDDIPTFEQRDHEAGKGDVFRHDEDHRLTLAALSQATPTGPPDLAAAYRQELTLGSVHERTLDKLTLAGTTSNLTVTPNNRYGYTAYGPVARTYDASGNLITRGTDTFKWDAKNRLVEANLAGGKKVELGYDALNRRVEKKVTIGATSTTTTYLFDGWNTVQETRGGALFRETVFGLGLDDGLEYRLYGTPNHDYQLFRDRTGSASFVLGDDSSITLFKYFSFGKPSLLTGTTGTYNFDLSGTTTDSYWQGLTLDPDLGWYYVRNRWYDPETGAFVSSDPLGYPDSPNPYVWGVSGPWAHDPLGLLESCPSGYSLTQGRIPEVTHCVNDTGQRLPALDLDWSATKEFEARKASVDPCKIKPGCFRAPPTIEEEVAEREAHERQEEEMEFRAWNSMNPALAFSIAIQALPPLGAGIVEREPAMVPRRAMSSSRFARRAGARGVGVSSFNAFESRFKKEFKDFKDPRFGSFAGEARFGWREYKRSNQGTDDLVIGRFPDTSNFVGQPGRQVLRLPKAEWSEGVNYSWIQGGIDRRAVFELASPPEPWNRRDPTGELTQFGKELNQLESQGYRHVGNQMLPPP